MEDLFQKIKELGKGWRTELVPIGEMIESHFILSLRDKEGEISTTTIKTSFDVWKNDVTYGKFADVMANSVKNVYIKAGYTICRAEIISKEKYQELGKDHPVTESFSFHESDKRFHLEVSPQ